MKPQIFTVAQRRLERALPLLRQHDTFTYGTWTCVTEHDRIRYTAEDGRYGTCHFNIERTGSIWHAALLDRITAYYGPPEDRYRLNITNAGLELLESLHPKSPRPYPRFDYQWLTPPIKRKSSAKLFHLTVHFSAQSHIEYMLRDEPHCLTVLPAFAKRAATKGWPSIIRTDDDLPLPLQHWDIGASFEDDSERILASTHLIDFLTAVQAWAKEAESLHRSTCRLYAKNPHAFMRLAVEADCFRHRAELTYVAALFKDLVQLGVAQDAYLMEVALAAAKQPDRLF